MRVLLDTCIISELWRKDGSEKVRHHISILNPGDTYLSVLTIGEIAKGIHLLKEGKKKSVLETKLMFLENQYQDNILTLDVATMKLWGEMLALGQKKEKSIPASDGLIAATALRHGLRIMTRNVSDFEHTGALLTNPWK